MSGARLIVNARYFHIAQPGEAAARYAFVPEAAANLVTYIATRESVVMNFSPTYETQPATQKQIDAIEQFRRSSPDIEKSREYKAYLDSQTAGNASRLITRATEYVFGLDEDGDSKVSRPATRAQRERIRAFVEKVPAIRDTPEYADFLANRTRENASEVLSHALEVAMENAADPETLRIMLNYIAERPGVIRDAEKQHGLFCSDGAADLEVEKAAIASHSGNIYSMVFSLRRADADALGYDTQEKWRDLFVRKQADMARELHVSLNELHWVAAVHNTRHHPHAHFIAYSDNPKTRMYLSQNAIEHIKSDFVAEIFREERYNLFAPREEIRQSLSDRLEQLLTQLDQNAVGELENLQIPQKLAALKEAIRMSKGRHVYKFLPQNVKDMVDQLLDDLSTVPEIRELLMEYNKYQKQLELYYKEHPDEPKPLSEITARSNLYTLKNLVVRTALQMETTETEYGMKKTGSTSGFSDSPAGYAAWMADQEHRARRIEPIREAQYTGGTMNREKPQEPDRDSSPEAFFRYAQYLRYETDNPEDAILWYNLAEQRGHAQAAYQLAQHYLNDADERDIRLGNEYLLTAKLRFESQLLESANAYLIQAIQDGKAYPDAVAEYGLYEETRKNQKTMPRAAYFLGRIHLCGIEIESMEGIEPEDIPRLQVPADPQKAAAYLELAYTGGYTHAAYYLGKLYQRGDLHPAHTPDFAQAVHWFSQNTKNAYCRFALAGMYASGQGVERDIDKAETLYRSCLQEAPYLVSESAYAVAQMQRYGSLPETDMQALYAKAAAVWIKQKSPETQMHLRLSHMYEHGLGVEPNVLEALKHSMEAEKAEPVPRVVYRTAQLMEKNNFPADVVYAKYWSALDGMLREEADAKAAPDAQRALYLARMYRYGLGTHVDTDRAITWYTVAAERGSTYAAEQAQKLAEQKQMALEAAKNKRNMRLASHLLSLIGNTLHKQILRDQQPGAQPDRKQRRQQRKLKHALGQKEDHEPIYR